MTEKSRFVILDRTRPGVHVDGAVDPSSVRPAYCGLNDIDDACLAHLASHPDRFADAVSRFMDSRSDREVLQVETALLPMIERPEKARLVHTDAEV